MRLRNEGHRDRMRSLIARAWADPEFMGQLRKDPKRQLADAGLLDPKLAADPHYHLRMVDRPEDIKSANDFFFMPRPSSGGEISDDQFTRALSQMDPQTNDVYPNCSSLTTCCCDITVAPPVF
jgi:hypothetical protein